VGVYPGSVEPDAPIGTYTQEQVRTDIAQPYCIDADVYLHRRGEA
jgi:hypothetical protein